MKLFKSLLIAPAALGLLAPMSATANEVNLNDVSNYSSKRAVKNISIEEFDAAKEIADLVFKETGIDPDYGFDEEE